MHAHQSDSSPELSHPKLPLSSDMEGVPGVYMISAVGMQTIQPDDLDKHKGM